MLEKIRATAKQKGQGIVEYALLLAFVVGIAMMLNGSNLGGAVKDTFDNVAVALGGVKDYASAIKNWSSLSKADILKEDKAKRIAADQEALANIGEFFIGMSRDAVKQLLENDCTKMQTLVHVGENDAEKMNNNVVGDGLSYVMERDINKDVIRKEHINDVIHWMQHDYGTHDGNGYSNNFDFNSGNRYFFSDYPVNNMPADGNKYYGNGIKLQLTYDSHNTVSQALVEIDHDTISSHKEMSMTVSKNADGKITRNPTYSN